MIKLYIPDNLTVQELKVWLGDANKIITNFEEDTIVVFEKDSDGYALKVGIKKV